MREGTSDPYAVFQLGCTSHQTDVLYKVGGFCVLGSIWERK